MAAPAERTLTFLRGSGFRLDLVGIWDLMADATGCWPAQKGFLIFRETQITAVLERHATMRRGIEGTYAIAGNRLLLTGLSIDTAPEQGALSAGEFTLEGDVLTITWLSTLSTDTAPRQVDTFHRRVQSSEGVLLPPVAIYTSDAPNAPAD
jgi:hypothetical protein